MTEEQPRPTATERLIALETAMAGMKDMLSYREQMLLDRIERLDARNRGQDQEQEAFAAMVKEKLGEYDALLLKSLAWLATAVGGMLLAGACKVLGIGWGG